jgi:hypothetical protein
MTSTQWLDDSSSSQYGHEGRSAMLWYSDGGWCWRVWWDGFGVKEGSACLDRKEARREANYWLERMAKGEVPHPSGATAERRAIEQRILDGRARLKLPPYQP